MRLKENITEIFKSLDRAVLGTSPINRDYQKIADLMSELSEARTLINQGLNTIDRDLQDAQLSFNYFTNELMKINITMEKIAKGGENE